MAHYRSARARLPSLMQRLFLLACVALLLPLSQGKWVSHLSSYRAYERRLASAEGPTIGTEPRESSGSDTITPGGLTLNSLEGPDSPSRPAFSPLLRGSALAAAASAELLSRGTREATEIPLAAAIVAEA